MVPTTLGDHFSCVIQDRTFPVGLFPMFAFVLYSYVVVVGASLFALVLSCNISHPLDASEHPFFL